MSLLTIRKKSLKTWLHVDSVLGNFIISKFYFSADGLTFQIVEQGQSKRVKYALSDITLYDDTNSGPAETFTDMIYFSLRLEQLSYPAFFIDGSIASVANLLQAGSGITITGDGTLESPYVIVSDTGGVSGATDLTHFQLLTKIADSDLTIGGYYRITDFRTVHKILGTSEDNSGELEPLLVLATGVDSISPIALSTTYPGDIIHYSVSDTTIMAPSSGSRGVIIYREDTAKNLSCHYDFREVIFRRWAINPAPGLYFAYSIYSSINSFQEVKTFGTGCKDISIGGNSFNCAIYNNCYAIKIGDNVGTAGAGVTINNNCHGIIIDEDSCQVTTVGAGYVGGIFIGQDSRYIRIGSRSYNIAIGSNSYAIDLGLQNSDIVVRDNSMRRRIEKGFSNFDTTINIDNSDTVSVYSATVSAMGGILYNSAQFCGILKITSPNAEENIERLDALLTSLSFQSIRVIPENGLKLNFIDKANATNVNKNLNLNGSNITVDGSKGESIEFFKLMEDTTGTQTSDFFIGSTNVRYGSLDGQDNFVRVLEIPVNLLSGVGSEEEQICEYILSLDDSERTILETDSKWNVVVVDSVEPEPSAILINTIDRLLINGSDSLIL